MSAPVRAHPYPTRLKVTITVKEWSQRSYRSQDPGPSQKKGEGCLRMRETTPGFYGGSYNSVPYRRLYLWTVRERPFYCLGVALRVRPRVVKVP